MLQQTEKTKISKEGEKCKKIGSYNPDRKIMKAIARYINCSLPWSIYKFNGMKECQTESDFERYLHEIVKLKPLIEMMPKKCTFKTWTPMPYSESSTDGDKTTVVVELTLIDSKVKNMKAKTAKAMFSIIFSFRKLSSRRKCTCTHLITSLASVEDIWAFSLEEASLAF